MPKLSDFLNRDETKTRIGFTNISGYMKALDAMSQVTGEKKEKKKKEKQSNDDVLDDMSVSTTVKDGITFINDNTLKQVKLNVLCGYPFPLYNDSTKTYHMAAPQNANINGLLNNEPSGFPASFQQTIIAAVKGKTQNVRAGVGLNLTRWGAQYLQEFFGDGTIGVTELKKLSLSNKLCAEVVIHDSSTLGSSGRVVYTNVVDCEVGDENSCLISPMFCFGSFKQLGLDFGFTCGGETSTLQSSQTIKPVKEPTYDYKTGEVTNISAADLEKFSNDAKENATIQPSCGKCCRVRLFVENLQEAQALVGGKTISPQMGEKNRKKTYTGGQAEVITGNATLNTEEHVDVAIDIGHSPTIDTTRNGSTTNRERINRFTVWSKEEGQELAKLAGFTPSTDDALEHALNEKVANVLSSAFTARGITNACYDYTELGGSAEFTKILGVMKTVKPKILISIHHNANGNDN